MKTLTRVAFYALALSLVPFSYSYAQEPVDLAPEADVEGAVDDVAAADVDVVGTEDDVAEEDDFSDADFLGEDIDIDTDTEVQPVQEDVVVEKRDPHRPPTLEEARRALEAMPGAKEAVTGEISTKVEGEIYDFYGRQLAYREGVKKYRASLDKRRENFSAPSMQALRKYQQTRDLIFAAETADYQRRLHEQKNKQANTGVHKLPAGEAASAVLAEDVAEEIGLKEQEVPSDTQEVKRKVVTAGDAPEFDPARLGEDPVSSSVPVSVEDVVPPPMPE